MDLLKTAIERDRIFVTKKVRQYTEESDEEGYFDKAPEEDEAVEIEVTPAAAETSKKQKKGVQFTPVPVAIDEPEEQAEFPEELPNQFGFAGFGKFAVDDRT